MVIEKLRSGTRQTHEELETEMLPLIKGVRDKDSYARLLHLFYGYYHPLEKGIALHLDSSLLPDIGERRKVSRIIDDLHIIGGSVEIREDSNAPLIENRAEAFGALYVMEGSTLGGKVISKMISGNLDFPDESALSFFSGYGSQTASRWKEFLAVLDQFSGTAEEEVIVSKANEVFSEFRVWLKQNIS